MKKNLKKVISAVLALTLAMSSFVAMTTSAATFADVADTANYAEAVNALAAIGAISGYEDGTFLPENNITRAEVTTMVVAALNMSADAQASGATTKFADVNEKAKWAAGYVNVGVANGWISGMSATEFAPSENVTYAQVLSMLTRILGYGDYAVSKGGWPDGYLAAAASAGILSGVSAAANDAMTRAQVARLIWNAVQAPMLEVTIFGVNAVNSSMEKLDGDGNEFKTILSDKFDAYVFPNVEVVSTPAQGEQTGEVKLKQLVKAPWNPEANGYGVANSTMLNNVKVGKTDADKYPFASAKVIASYVDDEWELLYFKPTAKLATTTVDGSLVAAAGVDATELQIKKSSVTTAVNKYKLTANTEIYVNGKSFHTITADNDATAEAIIKTAVGDVVLYENANVTTGLEYNKIMVNTYALAKVTQVQDKADQVSVRFTAGGTQGWPASNAMGYSNIGTGLTVTDDDVANGDVVVNVTKAGAAADLSALAKGDIIAIKYDVTAALSSAKEIEILASSDVVTGAYTYYDDVEDLYEVGGAMYEAAFASAISSIERGTTYTFALDPFGRLYSANEEASTKNYAIVEKYNDVSASHVSSEYDYLDVVTLDGQSKRLYVDNTTNAMTNAANAVALLVGGVTSNGITDFTGTGIAGRVIEYGVKTSTGRVNAVKRVVDNATYTAASATDKLRMEEALDTFTTAKYSAVANRLGKPLASSVTVLDASAYVGKGALASTSDYKASSLDALSESVNYNGILIHPNSSNQYTYLVLTLAGAKYGPTSDFAVAAAASNVSSGAIVDDEDVYTLRVMKDGGNEPEVLNIAKDAQVWKKVAGSYTDVGFTTNAIAKGSAFFYTVDSYGLVDRIDVVLEGAAAFDTYRDNAVVYTPNTAGNVIQSTDWNVQVNEQLCQQTSNEVIQLFVAPVIGATDTSVTFSAGGEIYTVDTPVTDTPITDTDGDGVLDTGDGIPDVGDDTLDAYDGAYEYIDTNVAHSYGIAADANIYYYDMSSTAPTNYAAFSGGAFAGIDVSAADASGKAWISHVPAGEIDFDGMLQVAFVMVVDGMVTNALVIGE